MEEIHNAKYMKLRDWVPMDKLDWKSLSMNLNAIPILEKTGDITEDFGFSLGTGF